MRFAMLGLDWNSSVPGAERFRKQLFVAWLLILADGLFRTTFLVAQASAEPLSESKVLALLRGGVPVVRVSSLVKQYKISFAVDADAEQQLRLAGATDSLISTLKSLVPSNTVVAPASQVPPRPLVPAEQANAGGHDNESIQAEAHAAKVAPDSDREASHVFAQAQTALGAKRYEEANALFGTAARLRPGWSEPLIEKAKLDAKLGLFAQTIEDCTVALLLKPNDPLALNLRGLARYSLNRLDDALADYNAAIRARPDYAEAYTNRGNTRWAMKDKEGASRDFATAKQLQQER